MHKNAELHYETFPISWRWVEWIPSEERVLESSNGVSFNFFEGFFKEFGSRRVISGTKNLFQILFEKSLYTQLNVW